MNRYQRFLKSLKGLSLEAQFAAYALVYTRDPKGRSIIETWFVSNHDGVFAMLKEHASLNGLTSTINAVPCVMNRHSKFDLIGMGVKFP